MVLQIGSWYLHGTAAVVAPLVAVAVVTLLVKANKSSGRKARSRRSRAVGGRR
jgi:hypothetical protein